MIRSTLRQFIIYGAGNIAQAALAVILLPLYLRLFEPSAYGVISLLSIVTSLLTILASVGIITGLFRLYYEAEPAERKSLVGNACLWYLLGAALGGAALFVPASQLSQALFHTGEYSHSVRMVGIFLFVSLAQTVPFAILRLNEKAGLYVGFSLFRFLLDFGLKFYFIAVLGRGVSGYWESGVISYSVVLCCMLPFIMKYVSLSPNAPHLRQLLRLGLPFVFSGLAVWTLSFSDRLMLNYFRDEATVGIYSLAYSLASIFFILLTTPVTLVIDPFFFSYSAGSSIDDTKRLLRRMLVYLFLGGSILYLAIVLGSGDVLKIFTSLFGAKAEYHDAQTLVPLLTLAPFLYLLLLPPSLALLQAKKPEFNSIAAVVAAVASFGFNFLLVPRYGAWGAASTAALAYVLYGALCFWWAERTYRVNYSWANLARALLFLAIAFATGWEIRISHHPWFSLAARVGAGVTVFGLLTWFASDLLTKSEKASLLGHIPILKSLKKTVGPS